MPKATSFGNSAEEKRLRTRASEQKRDASRAWEAAEEQKGRQPEKEGRGREMRRGKR